MRNYFFFKTVFLVDMYTGESIWFENWDNLTTAPDQLVTDNLEIATLVPNEPSCAWDSDEEKLTNVGSNQTMCVLTYRNGYEILINHNMELTYN